MEPSSASECVVGAAWRAARAVIAADVGPWPIALSGMDAPERDCCPYVDAGHACCGDRFRLDRFGEALETCFSDAHRQCNAHAQLQVQFGAAGPPPTPVVITVSATCVAVTNAHAHRLRPTGS